MRREMAQHFEKKLSSRLLVMAAKSSRYDSTEWLPFWMHSLDTAGVLKKLVRRWIPLSVIKTISEEPEEVEKLVTFLGLVHDIGKMTAVFQNRLLTNIAGQIDRLINNNISITNSSKFIYGSKTPHSIAGEAILIKEGCPRGIAAIVGAHHGKPIQIDEDVSLNLGVYKHNYYAEDKEQWDGLWKEWIEFSLEYAGYESMESLPSVDMATQFLLTAILIVGDWIASNISYFPLIKEDENPTDGYYPKRINCAWERIAFPDRWMPQNYFMDRNDFKDEFEFFPNEVQQSVMEISSEGAIPGLILIEAQMGNGKTEAALVASEVLASRCECGGIYFGLPSQATSNGLFPRVKEWAKRQAVDEVHSLELLHGSAHLNTEYQTLFENVDSVGEDFSDGGVIIHQWFEGRKTGLLADFAVGTIDQILMAALKKKHVMLRMLGLVGKIVIIDECHAYDAYMNHYLDRVLNWLGRFGIPVVLLSATLPLIRKRELVKAYLQGKDKRIAKKVQVQQVGYPMITWTEGLNVRQRGIFSNQKEKIVQVAKINEDDVVGVLENKLSDGGCAGVIVNTVKYAQDLAQSIQRSMPEWEVILFHSRFTMMDRAGIESELIRRLGKTSTQTQRNRLIIVGTQVLEQSLDIDFDLMVTQLCPMDLLLQRIGRLHRHARERAGKLIHPECYVVVNNNLEIDSGSVAVYGKWLLHRTKKYLPDIVSLPESIPSLVESVYGECDNSLLTEEEKEMLQEYTLDQQKKEDRADQFCICPPSISKYAALNTIEGMLDTSVTENSDAEAAVRDGDGTIEVILMIKKKNDKIAFLPWQHGGDELRAEDIPCKTDALRISMQIIRLPGIFNYCWRQTVEELKAVTMTYMPRWQETTLLKGELFLLLDENRRAVLAGKKICYTQKEGLLIESEGTI